MAVIVASALQVQKSALTPHSLTDPHRPWQWTKLSQFEDYQTPQRCVLPVHDECLLSPWDWFPFCCPEQETAAADNSKGAKTSESVLWAQVMVDNLQVMDGTAITLCKENDIKVSPPPPSPPPFPPLDVATYGANRCM